MISLSLSLEREFDNYVSVMLPYERRYIYFRTFEGMDIHTFVRNFYSKAEIELYS